MEIQKIFSGKEGEERIYSVLLSESEYEIYQKEFGLIRNLRNKGVSFLDKSIDKDRIKFEENQKYLENTPGLTSKNREKLKEGLEKKSGDLDIAIRDDFDNSGPFTEKLDDSIKEKLGISHIVTFPNRRSELDKENEGLEGLAHELGHVENYKKGGISRKIHEKANKINQEGRLELDKNKKGLIQTGKDIRDGFIVNQEESRASKNGLNFLKESGVSKEDYNLAKEQLDHSLRGYKLRNRARWKTTLRDTIKPKNEKGGK